MAIDRAKYEEILAELGADVQLIAVSKTKPAEDILALYEAGQRDFGENYVQELADKQSQLPADIRWHFIGHLQSNKVKYIIPFIHLIHGVDSLRLLKEIDRQASKIGRIADVLLQVHIAREETKFGLDADELADLLQTVGSAKQAATGETGMPGGETGRSGGETGRSGGETGRSGGETGTPGEWTHVRIRGLMGMASFSDDPATVREEFCTLKALFDQYFAPGAPDTRLPSTDTYKTDTPHIDTPHSDTHPAAPHILSMGMSSDYHLAVEAGSTMVRIGSLLFGKRS